MKSCMKCGAELDDFAFRCNKCGADAIHAPKIGEQPWKTGYTNEPVSDFGFSQTTVDIPNSRVGKTMAERRRKANVKATIFTLIIVALIGVAGYYIVNRVQKNKYNAERDILVKAINAVVQKDSKEYASACFSNYFMRAIEKEFTYDSSTVLNKCDKDGNLYAVYSQIDTSTIEVTESKASESEKLDRINGRIRAKVAESEPITEMYEITYTYTNTSIGAKRTSTATVYKYDGNMYLYNGIYD